MTIFDYDRARRLMEKIVKGVENAEKRAKRTLFFKNRVKRKALKCTCIDGLPVMADCPLHDDYPPKAPNYGSDP